MTWLEQELSKAYEIQTQKLGMSKDCQQEGKVLNRIIRCTDAGWEIEADPRHAELVVEQLGIEDKGVSTPGVLGIREEDEEGDVPLVGEDITRYRGVIACCNYMAADRPDCVFAIKEGSRKMSKPTTGSIRRLRCIGRYLEMHPGLVWKYALQGEVNEITVRTDADWAGCRRARKSTSGGSISRASHCIQTWSALGTKMLCEDLGE